MASKADRSKKSESKSKLGKNPFEKKGRSQVGRMIEASFSSAAPEVPVKVQDRSLFERVQDMNLSLDLRELVKSIRSRTI